MDNILWLYTVYDTITSLFEMQYANAQLISVEDTTVNIPITVIVPIDLNIQSAQICASVASRGDQSCTQLVLNPEQTSYTDYDLERYQKVYHMNRML